MSFELQITKEHPNTDGARPYMQKPQGLISIQLQKQTASTPHGEIVV